MPFDFFTFLMVAIAREDALPAGKRAIILKDISRKTQRDEGD